MSEHNLERHFPRLADAIVAVEKVLRDGLREDVERFYQQTMTAQRVMVEKFELQRASRIKKQDFEKASDIQDIRRKAMDAHRELEPG